MKKMLNVLMVFVLVMLLSAMCGTSAEAAVKKKGKVDNISYKVSGATITFSGKGEFTGETLLEINDLLTDKDTTDVDKMYKVRNGIKKIVIQNGITRLSCSFGQYLGSVTTVSLPASVKAFEEEDMPFFVMGALNKVVVAKKNKDFKVKNKMLLSKNGKTLYRYFGNSIRVKVPASVRIIHGAAFDNNMNLQKIKFPKKLQKIGESAFLHNFSLKEISLPKNCKNVGVGAFEGCGSLEKVTLCKGIKRIERMTFYGCSSLKKITLPKGLQYIGDNAFNYSNLKSITIPASVTEIGENAFVVKKSVKKVTFLGKKAPTIEGLPFVTYKEKDGIVMFHNKPVSQIVVPKGATGFSGKAWEKYKIVYK